MKKITQTILKNNKRIVAFLVLCTFVFSAGCSKKRDLSLPQDGRNAQVIGQISQSFKSMYNDPNFKKAVSHPDFPKAKIYSENYQASMYDFMAGTIYLYEINEKLKAGQIESKEKLDTLMAEALSLKENSATKMESDFKQYSTVLKDTGVAQVIDNHFEEIMENKGSEFHPMVKGSTDYFTSGLGVDKQTVVNQHNDPKYQEMFKDGYTSALNNMETTLGQNKQQEVDKKTLMLSKTAEYFAAKQITDLEIIPEQEQTKWCGPACWLRKLLEWLKYLFRLFWTTTAKVLLHSIDLFCVIHYNEYFAPNVQIYQTGYTPGFGFFVGGGRVDFGNVGAIPTEYPVKILNKWVKGYLVYQENLFFLELDGEKTLITKQESIPGWVKSSVKSRGNRIMVEATINMIVEKEKIFNLSGIGYSLEIKYFNKIYRDANGPKVVLYDPIGLEVAYNTNRAMVKFSEDIDPSTVNSTNFFIKDENGNDFPCTVVYDKDPYAVDENAVFLNFSTPIIKGKTYIVTMTDAVKGNSGKYVQSSVSWSFTVGAYSNLFDASDASFDNSRFGY